MKSKNLYKIENMETKERTEQVSPTIVDLCRWLNKKHEVRDFFWSIKDDELFLHGDSNKINYRVVSIEEYNEFLHKVG